MKTELKRELTLQDLAPYLPYGLKGMAVFIKVGFKPVELIGFSRFALLVDRGEGVDEYCHIIDFKPLLIPLSELTVLNADGLTPMHELLEIDLKQMGVKPIYFVTECKRRDYDLLKKHDYVISYVMDDTVYHLVFDPEYNRFTSRQMSPIERPLWTDYQPLHKYLISNHYDVFGLLDAGLALNKLEYHDKKNSDDVTHEVFFGENIKRVIKTLKI